MNDQNFDQNSYVPPVNEAINPAVLRPRIDLHAAFGSGLFLAICILMTIATAVGSFSITFNQGNISTSYGLDLLSLLITIGLWITYGSAKKNDGPIKKGGLTLVSGTLKAMRIIYWVAAGIFAVCGALLIVAAVAAPAAFYDQLLSELNAELNNTEFIAFLTEMTGQDFSNIEFDLGLIMNGSTLAIVFIAMGIFLLLVAVIFMIFNLTFYKRLHQFAKSVCACAENPDALPEYTSSVSTWLLVMGILSIFSGLSGVIMILGYVLIRKYFVDI